MVRRRNPESEFEYRQREIRSFFKELQDIQKGPDRKDGYIDLKELLLDKSQHRYLVEEVFGWLLNGSFGAGSYYWFWGLNAKPKIKAIMGFMVACQLNFNTSEYYVRKAVLETLSKSEMEAFNNKLIQEMTEQQREI